MSNSDLNQQQQHKFPLGVSMRILLSGCTFLRTILMSPGTMRSKPCKVVAWFGHVSAGCLDYIDLTHFPTTLVILGSEGLNTCNRSTTYYTQEQDGVRLCENLRDFVRLCETQARVRTRLLARCQGREFLLSS